MQYGLKDNVLVALKAVFENYSLIDEVLLYGSRAIGNYREGSDIDIVIKGNDLSSIEMSRLMNDIDELLLPYMIDLCQFSEIDNSELINHIDRVGKIIYVKD